MIISQQRLLLHLLVVSQMNRLALLDCNQILLLLRHLFNLLGMLQLLPHFLDIVLIVLLFCVHFTDL